MASLNSHAKNLRNAAVALLSPLPSIFFYLSFLRRCSAAEADSLSPLWSWCHHHPLLLANLLFFLNVNLLFWILGLLQSSHWLMDLYWTVIPVMLVHFFANHPSSESDGWRSRTVILLTWVWFVRLNHSYFRREKWQWGAREDWRLNDMRFQYGHNWWWISFFAVYLSQQVFLMGVCFPFYIIHSKDEQYNAWDAVAAVMCSAGVAIAYFSDTQLHDFTVRNERLKQQGEAPMAVLEEGLWRYSRHPNYVGEQLWWWGLVAFAWNLGGGWWCCGGAIINSLVLAYVTKLVEERMLKQEYRAESYVKYQKTTSVWVPWFKTSLEGKEKET
ncbi:hypothetical protein ACS0TY_036588 [Phlomoides rotata]